MGNYEYIYIYKPQSICSRCLGKNTGQGRQVAVLKSLTMLLIGTLFCVENWLKTLPDCTCLTDVGIGKYSLWTGQALLTHNVLYDIWYHIHFRWDLYLISLCLR